jgi:hypothetical protein
VVEQGRSAVVPTAFNLAGGRSGNPATDIASTRENKNVLRKRIELSALKSSVLKHYLKRMAYIFLSQWWMSLIVCGASRKNQLERPR